MNLYVALSLFSVIILIYLIITELFTILFRFTGLPDERARFQVISLLTGCGFTTRESEMILSNRRRRRLARITMLFGYVFNITIVSAFINVFLSLKLNQVEHYMGGFMIPLIAVAVILIFMRVPKVRAWGDRQLATLAGRVLNYDTGNLVLMLDYIGQDSIAQVLLKNVPASLADKPLSQSGLRSDHNILVMLVETKGEKPKPVGADTVFQAGDKLTVFGEYAAICRVFEAHETFEEL